MLYIYLFTLSLYYLQKFIHSTSSALTSDLHALVSVCVCSVVNVSRGLDCLIFLLNDLNCTILKHQLNNLYLKGDQAGVRGKGVERDWGILDF